MPSYNGFDTLPSKATSKVEPFELHVPDSELADFKTLLKLSKVAPETWENSKASRDSGKYYGVTRDWVANAKDTWLNKFDWRAHEAHINSFPNFKTTVRDDHVRADQGEESKGTFDVHFTALFSRNKDAVPVIFMHGWPGCFLEFLPMLGLLRDKYTADTLPFHAIVPSLPGYGLSSGPPTDRDFTPRDAGRVLNRLMVGLGFGDGYVAQGGDVGYFLARSMSAWYDECKALHVNFMSLPAGADPTDLEGVEPHELQELQKAKTWSLSGTAYANEHATRPGTIGLVLSASPLGLLSWIGEKYIEWANTPIPLETILQITTLYWFTSSMPRNIYPYRDLFRGDGFGLGPISTTKPLGYSAFKDLTSFPKAWHKHVPNMKFRKDHDAGGHFAALEEPKAFLDDIEAFLKVIGPLQ